MVLVAALSLLKVDKKVAKLPKMLLPAVQKYKEVVIYLIYFHISVAYC